MSEELPEELRGRIQQGEAAFRVQSYDKVIEILDRLAGHPALDGRPENVRVLEMLGASHWFMSARDPARLVFGQLLREAPFHHLDEFVYPPELLDFFETRRREMVTAGIIPATPTTPPVEPERILVREISEDDTPAVVFLAPFGVGQFVNGDSGKGTAMAIIQGLGAATMIGSTIGIETLKVGGTNRVREEDGNQARLLEALWFGGAIVLGASWIYSIVDGLAYRRTTPVIKERYELLEDEESGDDVTLRVLPAPTGVGLSVDF